MEYPKPSITVDIIVYDRRSDSVLLIKRDKAPFEDCWAIPGGFFNPIDHHDEKQDVSLKVAAIRELKEETNIDADPKDLAFFTIQDKPDRDPRGRTITMVYVLTLWDGIPADIKAQDDAADVSWWRLKTLATGKIPLAFDHQEEIDKFHNSQSVMNDFADRLKKNVLTALDKTCQTSTDK